MVGSTDAGNAGSINISVGLAGTTSGGLQLWAATNQTHYIQFGDATSGAAPYTGYIGYAHNNDSLIFGTATSTKMTLNASGNLSLGNTNDTYKLDVTGTGRYSGAITVNLTTAASAINLVNTSTNNIFTTYSNASNNTYIGLVGNNGVVQTNNDFEVYTGASYTKRLTIAHTGAATFSSSIKTGEPDTGWGRAAIKIGQRQSGEAFSSGGYLPVNVDGTVYYINLYSSTP